MIITSIIIIAIMNIINWVSTTKVEKELEDAKKEIEELKQILRSSEK